MDGAFEESDTDESQWTALRYPARKSSASASSINDDRDAEEGYIDLHTADCPFCACWIHEEAYPDMMAEHLSTTELQHILFHKECQSCSSLEDSQISFCDFCKHLRLGHLLWCMRGDPNMLETSIDLDPISRALSRTKCDLCDFLTNAISLPRAGLSEAEITLETSAILKISFYEGTEIIVRKDKTTRPYSVYLDVGRQQAPTNTLPDFEESVQWDIVRRWLLECHENHGNRCAYRPRPTVPPGFRVIDVNNRCVVEREGFCEYMALSYVWGSRSESACYVEQATCDNIESLKVPGDLIQLPDTIEDAIVMCQKLGIQYLWVDRYCIVQDHAVHKHTQISAMADIYSSSTVIVIACLGDSVESGIPGVRRKRPKRCRINIHGLVLSCLTPHLDKIISGSIWNTRGWTHQEAALSRRNLIMAPMEVWFQCRKVTQGEHCDDPRYLSSRNDVRLQARKDHDRDYTIFADYAENVEMYTKRKLGYASDIYNAFDGIAQALYTRDDGFHFGLPEPHFDQALLWYCGCRWNDSRSRCHRICLETTPSWSWSSATCGVVYDDFGMFCMSLVKWVLYKTQVADITSQSAKPEAYRAQCVELKATGDPDTWRGSTRTCPQIFLALAMNEGCIKAVKASLPEHKSFSSLENQFTRRWPRYTDAYNEVLQIDTRKSSRPNGVLFTKAQSAIFNIRSIWIQNANGMVIGRVHQMRPRKITEWDHSLVSKIKFTDPEEDRDYEECSNYEECCDDEECCVEGIALSISEAGNLEVAKLVYPDISLWDWRSRKLEWGDLLRDLTYFDCNEEPLNSVPRVNVMFINWEDGYARRIGLGWIALKQWSSLDWTLKDIWLK